MTMPILRQPNIQPSLSDKTRITLNLFDTILKTSITQTELERSCATIERDIDIQEYLEARQRQLRDRPYIHLPELFLPPFFHSLTLDA
jgi:hypothetical protein